MAVYIQKAYISDNIRREIRPHCGAQYAARLFKEKYRWTQQILDNIEWELHAVFIQNQKYSRKKTTIKYIHRWLPSGSKSFGQNIGCSHCEGDGTQHDHDHFLTCEFSIERKEERINAITDKMKELLTPKDICDGILKGILNFYNNTIEKEEKRPKNKSIINQNTIGWQHFCRGRVSKQLAIAMETYYTQHPDNPNFTGKGWTKQMIALMLTNHVEEGRLRCHNLTSPKKSMTIDSPVKKK